MNRASVFEWQKRFKEGRESVRNDEGCGRSKEVNTPELIHHIIFQKLLERYNKCIVARGDYFEGDLSFMSVPSIKVPI